MGGGAGVHGLADARGHVRAQRRLFAARPDGRRTAGLVDHRAVLAPPRRAGRDGGNDHVTHCDEFNLLAAEYSRPAALVAAHIRRGGLLAVVHADRNARHARRGLGGRCGLAAATENLRPETRLADVLRWSVTSGRATRTRATRPEAGFHLRF